MIRPSLLAIAIWTLARISVAADVLPQPMAPFKGKIGFSARDSVPDWPEPASAPPGAPSIVLILLDDVGFGAAGTFGGPVQTPNLDQLAAQGLRYNRFHVTALCSPTRASLLSGRNDHRTSFGSVTGQARGYPGYNGIWKKSVVTVAEVLRRNGYSTAAFGKWHNTPEWEITSTGPFDRWPTGLGFEYFYGSMMGLDNQWSPRLYRNTTRVERPRTSGQKYHFTTDIANEAIQWLQVHESRAPNKPYLLYFAPGATHAPHYAPKEWIDKYRGQFDQGWNKVREETLARQKKLGVVPEKAQLTAWPKELPVWDSFNPGKKRLFARQMEVYAGFLAHTDYEIGRLLQGVREQPDGENTLIIYIVGDNGGSSEAGPEGTDAGKPLEERLRHLDDPGSDAYFNEYAAGWGLAMNTPFQWSKQVASHFGGTRAPVLISWPARIKDHGGMRSQFAHVNDVAATLYEVTGIRFPSDVDGVRQTPLDGTSLAYTFDQPSAPSRHRVQVFEQLGNRAIYADGWVAGARHSLPWEWDGSDDFTRDRWELYHVDDDFSEAHDLAARYPDRLQSLQQLFDAEAKANDIYPLGNLFNDRVERRRAPAPQLEFVFHPGQILFSHVEAPDFSRPHRISAETDIPEHGAEGTILCIRATIGGFSLYLKNDRLVYRRSGPHVNQEIVSAATIPAGKAMLVVQAEGGESEGAPRAETVHLLLNGQEVGRGTLSAGAAVRSPLSLSVGTACNSEAGPEYPIRFSGDLTEVRVQLK